MHIPDETLRSATSHVPAGRYIAGSMKKGWRTVKRIEKNRELEREREREKETEKASENKSKSENEREGYV